MQKSHWQKQHERERRAAVVDMVVWILAGLSIAALLLMSLHSWVQP